MIFGVFDGLHPGHQSLLRQAKRYGDLIVVVARDKTVTRLKHKKPAFRERIRVAHLKNELGKKAKVILGDTVMGKYTAVKKYKPNLICLGYDQNALHKDLRARIRRGELPRVPMKKLKPHKPHRYHTSLRK